MQPVSLGNQVLALVGNKTSICQGRQRSPSRATHPLCSRGLWEGNHIPPVALAPLGSSSQASSEPKSWVCLGCSASPLGQGTPAVGPELPALQGWGASAVLPQNRLGVGQEISHKT